MRMKIVFAAALLAGLAGMGAAGANDHPNLKAESIRSQQAQIRMDVEGRKGRFKDFDERKRSDLLARQHRVDGLLEGVVETTDLNEFQQIELFNQLEAIEALVNSAEDDRMICERHKPTGSKRPQTVCRTVAQRRAANEAAQREMTTRDQR